MNLQYMSAHITLLPRSASIHHIPFPSSPQLFPCMLWTLLLLSPLTQCSALFDGPGHFIGDEFDLGLDIPESIQNFPRDKSDYLHEFKPVSNTIVQSGFQYYSFNVNASTGLGEVYQYLVFITGNICSEDSNIAASANQSLTVYYSFNSLMVTNLEVAHMSHFENGYFQALTDVALLSTGSTVLYIAVQAPQSTNTSATWSYMLGVSQNDLVFQYDNRSFVEVVDTDHESALIVTGNLTAPDGADPERFNATMSIYQLYVYTYDNRDIFADTNCSWCAIRNGPSLFASTSYLTSFTARGGGLYQQFLVTGLNASTKYVGYLVSDFGGAQSASLYGGAVYLQFEFDTMSTEACALVYDLEFCDRVAYSVPALTIEQYATKEQLKELYDDRARALYGNFSKAMDQIACNTTDNAAFSPIRTCDDCKQLYKDWLCSVTIPRCSSRNITGYLYRTANQSRNAFIDEEVVPPLDYFEVLPCVNVCQAAVRDCPADFGFVCPRDNDSIKLSYYWDTGSKYGSCNFVGNYAVVQNGAAKLLVATWMLLLASVGSMMMV